MEPNHNEASTLLTALAFVRHGHAVFPVNWPVERNGRLLCSCGGDSRGRPCGKNAAKHPYGKLAPNGILSATIESGVVKHWFGYLAPQANLGLCTDRLVVLDIDPRHDGDASLAVLEREHAIPPTWRALTGGGGEHMLFACPDGIEVQNVVAALVQDPPLGVGIDVRGRGGYIVAPPSRHISGRSYAWSVDHHPADVPLASAPDWLISRLTAQTTAADGSTNVEPLPSDVWAQLTRQPITEYRDMAAARIAGHLFRHSCDYQLALGLLHAWNSAWCKPPLGYRELNRIVDRIADREAARIERELAQ
jgi:Bifunctional DNA primase/polymerase, N-terminal/Primase C terminal 1 (PriCT-1)